MGGWKAAPCSLRGQELWRGRWLNGKLSSSAADGSLKLWDLRKFKTPLCTADDLPCNYSMTQVRVQGRAHPCSGNKRPRHLNYSRFSMLRAVLSLDPSHFLQACYSPDEKFVLTGTSAEGKDSSGSLVVLDAQTLEKQGEIAVDGSAVAVQVCRQPQQHGHFLVGGLLACMKITIRFPLQCSAAASCPSAWYSGTRASTRFLWAAAGGAAGVCALSTIPSSPARVHWRLPRVHHVRRQLSSCR